VVGQIAVSRQPSAGGQSITQHDLNAIGSKKNARFFTGHLLWLKADS
jgi:hypothetical protein